MYSIMLVFIEIENFFNFLDVVERIGIDIGIRC